MRRSHRVVVVVGTEFGGMQAAISLAKIGAKASAKTDSEVILIDCNNFHNAVNKFF
ncbi:MAG: hypothetical protein AAGL08_20345 [Cyanobacteria bacterium J06573_11]